MNARLISMALAALAATSAYGSIVTFRFDGTITSNTFVSGQWSFAHAGDAFAVQYSFETTTPDSDPSMDIGNFGNCMTAFTVVAGTSFESGTAGGILVTNSIVGDGYQVGLTMTAGLAAFVHLGDATGTALSDDHLPTNLNFDAWLGRVFNIAPIVGPGPSLVGSITSFTVVPAPAAGAVIGIALLRGARRRR